MHRRLLLIGFASLLLSCASGPQVTKVQPLAKTSDAPYDNVLVISLANFFDVRRIFEDAIVDELEKRGIRAVASTSLMNVDTPAVRDTFLAMVDSLDSDAVLVTQLVSDAATMKMKDMNPQVSYNYAPTYDWNVWNVEQVEYVEPQGLNVTHDIVLATQLFSVRDLKPVWTIESRTEILDAYDRRGDISAVLDEARSIVSHLASDGALAP